MASRIYVVEIDGDESREYHLVDATTKAQAVHHVMQSRTRARVAKQAELVKLLGEGVTVEHAAGTVVDAELPKRNAPVAPEQDFE